ncbi:ATP-binding cassette domain-containing protein [Nesterenkonia sp. Act20]|uniref:ATP-binding cassette domain-containing protein n=1 Tax=Nesterenkonia sp. Act20 TaxID=1483432 RepID=UPI001C46455E|nr:ABC transporter ATP-binding protein [Nesterenkonia sp. Act20]
MPDNSPQAMPLLSLGGFSFTYRGADGPSLRDIDLVLRPGEAVAVLGPQGAGTSTLARAAAGLLGEHGHATGTRILDGAGIGMLGDDPEAQLTGLTRTVREEAALPGRLIGLPLQDCLDRAASSLESLGIEALAERALSTLSGGERQLTALAGLLTLGPGVLVLDQPSQSLDHSARRRLARSMREFRAAGGAVLLTGHQHDELSAECDLVLFLDQGTIVSNPESNHPGDLTEAQLHCRGIWNARGEAVVPDSVVAESAENLDSPPALRVRELSVRREETYVLDGIDLDLRPGETTVLLGANGSGKSTLLGALAGLVPAEPDAEVTGVAGVDLASAPAHVRAAHLAWVGQDPGDQISASTVIGELRRAVPLSTGGRRLGRDARKQARAERELDVAQVLEAADLTQHSEDHPYDLQPAQRKDCVIASALLLRPAVLLLDEPTLGRDAPGMERLSRLLRGFTAAGGAVLVSTHDRRWAAEISNHRWTLRAGRLHPHS